MKLTRTGALSAVVAAAVLLGACSSSKASNTPSNSPSVRSSSSAPAAVCSSGTLNAEGSTAQTNAMAAWIKGYQTACSGAKINYNPTGSGAGVSAFNAGQVDFAGSDSALNAAAGEVAAAQKRCGSAPLDLPMVVGPIALAYKLANVNKLILTGDVTAKIFLGKIKTWNDPAISALNPGVTLPSKPITVFYRSDSSGTTQNFEKYLAATAPSVFTSAPDKDSSKAHFAGQGKAKSQGVAAALAATDGSIGYVEYSFAVSSGLNAAEIDNGAGAVELSKDTASAAAGAAKITGMGDDLTLSINYATKTPGAYPIILVTYELACTKYADSAKGAFVKNFLSFTAQGGQTGLPQLGYAPLPTALQARVVASIAKIT